VPADAEARDRLAIGTTSRMPVVSVGLGFVIGLLLALLGGGGSILTVPVFVYVLGFGAKESIAMSLAVVGVTSVVGAAGHWRLGHVRLQVALLFGIVAMVGTYAGTRLATRLTGAEQLTIFAVAIVVAAAVMLVRRPMDPEHSRAEPSPGPSTSSVAFIAAQGLGVGLLTGLIGIGGGFLIVPALVWGGLALPQAIGTSLMAIAMNCAVGFYGYVGQVQIAWAPMALLAAGMIPGIATGTYVIQFIPQRVLRPAFAVFLFVLAAYMLYRTMPLVL
jgi:uncharacterized membrane protein YfcA